MRGREIHGQCHCLPSGAWAQLGQINTNKIRQVIEMDFPDFMGWREHLQVRPKCRAFRLTFGLRPIYLEVWIILNSLSFWYSTFPDRQRIIKDQRSWHEGVSWCLPRTSKDLRIPQILWTFWDEEKKRYTTVTTGLFVYAFGARWIPNVTQCHPLKQNFWGIEKLSFGWISSHFDSCSDRQEKVVTGESMDKRTSTIFSEHRPH